jgi:4'-phosphopantetheinyl transferase
LALVAVAAGREVGVDVEHFRPLPEVQQIAERYFSAREREALANLPEAERPGAFFNIWSCKEAFIKANGQGLTYPWQGFSVQLAPIAGQQPARVETGTSQDWGLRTLAVSAGYAGAVAVEGLDWEERLWQY